MSERILVTGGAGFIASNVIRYFLEETDCEVVTLDRIDSSSDLGRIGQLVRDNPEFADRIDVVWHDLKAELNINVKNRIGKIDYILHLAASSHVNRSIQDPLSFVMDNVVGTCNILNYARSLSDLKKFLYFSTDEVFGAAPPGVVFSENDRYNCGNPYSASKAGAEELVVSFNNTYGVPTVITHTMNVYGPHQHAEKFVPICLDKISRGEELTIHCSKDGSNISSRSYLHVDDVARGVKFVLDNCAVGQKYNISSGRITSNLELAEIVAKALGKELKYKLEYPAEDRPGNDLSYNVSGEKMKSLGWVPNMTLEEGIKKTADWYKK